MKESIVSFYTAQLAKEKGFDLPCPYRYIGKGTIDFWGFDPSYEHGFHRNNVCVGVSAPLQSLLEKWLRDIHEIKIFIIPVSFYEKYSFNIIYKHQLTKEFIPKFNSGDFGIYNTYEEALEKGLQEALTLISNTSSH